MSLVRLTRISGAGISTELSISYANGLSVTGSALTAVSIDTPTFDTNSSGVVITGVATATSFVGSGSQLTGVTVSGINTTTTSTFNNVNATGVITATSFVGDGSGLTGVSGGGGGGGITTALAIAYSIAL